MSTSRKNFDGYYIIMDNNSNNKKMVLQGPWKNQYENIIEKENISGLRLSGSNNWRQKSIEFVKNLSIITDLEIYNWDVTDISPIQSLHQIKHLSLECNYKNSVDFSNFRYLQTCFLRWRPKSDSIFSASSLNSLNIVNYPYEDLRMLEYLSNLNELQLTSINLKDLKGIDKLVDLKCLDLYKCSKLESIDYVQCIEKISQINIDSCKKFFDIDSLSSLQRLEILSINNCGEIKTLKPLESCNILSKLYFIEDTKILDGDLTIFKKLKKLDTMWFKNRSQYNYSREQIKEALNVRRTSC